MRVVMRVYACICVYMCVYVCICVYMCVYVCIGCCGQLLRLATNGHAAHAFVINVVIFCFYFIKHCTIL